MTPALEAVDLVKTYRVVQRQPGLRGALRSLFRPKYETVRAVDGVSFRIEPGEFVGFLGPNGAGKTTTLKMLSGLVTPDSGTARVLGHVPWHREDAYKRRFSLVMGQKNQLWWDLPAGDSFLLNRDIYGIPEDTYRRTLDELLGLLDVAGKTGTPVRELSLGERMKMELVAALLHRPEVVLLDEPTIGLDVTAQAGIRECLRDYNRRRGVTVLLTSHYMKDIEALCPRVIVVNHGRIVYDGALSGVQDRFGRHKRIKVRFAPGAVPPPEPGLTVDAATAGTATGARHDPITRADGVKVLAGAGPERRYEVPRERIAAFTAEVLSSGGLEDIGIEDPPLEELIGEVFRSTSPRPETASAAPTTGPT